MSDNFDVSRLLSVQLILNIKAGGENEPCSVYYQLEAGQDFCKHDSKIEFKVVNGVINKYQEDTNVFTLKKHSWDESPEFKLDIGIADINNLLSSKQATLRLIISVRRA